MPTIIQMKRRAVSDIGEVVEKIKNDPEFEKADMVHSEFVPNCFAPSVMPRYIAALLCIEQYYFRSSSRVSASVLITQRVEEQRVTIVCPTQRESLARERADQSMAHRAEEVLLQMGFVGTSEMFD